MEYYFFPIIAFFVYLIGRDENLDRQILSSMMLFFLLVGITLFTCLRSPEVGTDYPAYESLFYYPNDIEIGFAFIANLFTSMGLSYRLFLSFFFVLTLIFRILVFTKLSKNLSILLMVTFGFWFLVYDLNGIRQGLSIAILGLAAYYAYEKKIGKYLFYFIVAALLHSSSLVFLPFYFLINIKIPKKIMILLVITAVLFSAFGFSDYLFSFLLQGSASGAIVDKVSTYSQSDEFNSNIILSFNMFHRLLIFTVTLLLIDKIPAVERLKTFILTAAFLNVLIFTLLSRFEIIATRGSLPFRYIECIFFSYLPFTFDSKLKNIAVAFILLLYIVLQIYQTLSIPDGNLIPYKSILF